MTDESLAPDVPEPEADPSIVPLPALGEAAGPESAPPEPQVEPAEADAEAPDAVAETLRRLDDRLEESQRLLARQVDLVERLHDENQRLRQGELRAAQLPFVRDVLRLHDDVVRMAAATAGESQRDLAIVHASLVDALARNGIVDCSPQPESPFDAARHSAVGIVAVSDAAQDRTIVETVRSGFAWEDGQLVRVAEVRVAKHQTPTGPLEDDGGD
jgi:molecular chaperone GrpE (heat shock protein)